MANRPGYELSNDTIFVTGLPEDSTEEQLADYFGQIGIIKFDKKNDCKKIWIYKDKATGKGKGEATITYDDPPTATSAIQWFDGKEFRGSRLKVELAQRKSAPQFSRGGGGGGGYRGGQRGDSGRGGYDRGDRRGGGGGGGGGGSGRGGYDRGDRSGSGYGDRSRSGDGGGRGGYDRGGRSGGGGGRPGDWLCQSCNNNNFAHRLECNRCKTQKPHSASHSYGGSGGGGGGGGGSGSGGDRKRAWDRSPSHHNGNKRIHVTARGNRSRSRSRERTFSRDPR